MHTRSKRGTAYPTFRTTAQSHHGLLVLVVPALVAHDPIAATVGPESRHQQLSSCSIHQVNSYRKWEATFRRFSASTTTSNSPPV